VGFGHLGADWQYLELEESEILHTRNEGELERGMLARGSKHLLRLRGEKQPSSDRDQRESNQLELVITVGRICQRGMYMNV
jgi:hypothetical protein